MAAVPPLPDNENEMSSIVDSGDYVYIVKKIKSELSRTPTDFSVVLGKELTELLFFLPLSHKHGFPMNTECNDDFNSESSSRHILNNGNMGC